ncbi:MAG: UDP-N-acetylmuramoyl-L-alanyl-D-glutamate--2,6-diaminopimelate ligase [Candidatus Paceibacterota bacterium]|jgi:UDP-N-acetylmuramoyl-L-alanyl-D-glutamate--2,6-diaminopimelate ligase
MKNPIKSLKLKRRVITTLARVHFFGNPSAKLKIVGVTGTNGKTTTATLLYRTAIALGYKAGLMGTVENMINGERILSPETAPQTTPDSIYLHKLLNKMVDKGCEYVFMEVSSHALDQSRVAGIKFAGGIFTNLTHDHMDYHKNFDNYFGAKKKFFTMLPANAFALTNADDEYGPKMLEGIKARKFSYSFEISPIPGIGEGELFRGEIKKLDFNGLKLDFNGEEINSKLLGKFNAANLLAVWSTCKLLNFDMEKVKKILANIEPPRGRFDHFMSKNGVLVIVDYAHTPDALEKVLLTVKEIKNKEGKIISLFGCGGDKDPFKRKVMGKIAATFSNITIFTADNPRSEDPAEIINQMKESLTAEDLKKVIENTDRHNAILEAVKIAQKGDIILAVGKGHENYQDIKGVRSYFDDMEEFQKAYEQL